MFDSSAGLSSRRNESTNYFETLSTGAKKNRALILFGGATLSGAFFFLGIKQQRNVQAATFWANCFLPAEKSYGWTEYCISEKHFLKIDDDHGQAGRQCIKNPSAATYAKKTKYNLIEVRRTNE